MLGHSGPEHELAVASAIKTRLQRAFAEEEFNDWGWTSSRMQRNGLARSPKQLGDNNCKVWGEAAGSSVAAPGGTWRSVGFLFLPELRRVCPWRGSSRSARRGAVSHVAMPSAAPAHTNIAAV